MVVIIQNAAIYNKGLVYYPFINSRPREILILQGRDRELYYHNDCMFYASYKYYIYNSKPPRAKTSKATMHHFKTVPGAGSKPTLEHPDFAFSILRLSVKVDGPDLRKRVQRKYRTSIAMNYITKEDFYTFIRPVV